MSGSHRLIEAYEGGDGATRFVLEVPPLAMPSSLTPAERDVAARIVEGAGHAAIAAARGVSLPTVNKQVVSVFRKMKVGSRAELVAALMRPPADR